MDIAIIENNYVKTVIVTDSLADADALFPSNDKIVVTEATDAPFIGERYLPEIAKFVPYSPFPSWILDETTAEWKAPKPMPTDGKLYKWDEEAGEWKVLVREAE